MAEKKLNFFRKILISIKDLDKYEDFAIEKIGQSIRYLLLLMLIFSLIVCVAFGAKTYQTFKKGISYLQTEIGDLNYYDGELHVSSDEPIGLQNENEILEIVIIDTNADEEAIEKYNEKLNLYNNGIIILQDKLILKNSMLSKNVQYDYKDILGNYDITEFDKAQLIDTITSTNAIYAYIGAFAMVYIYLFVVYLSSTLVDIMILSILGYLIAKISRIKLKFSASFNIGVHAITLPLVLNMIYIVANTFTGFTINNFQWMYTTISYIYVVVAVLMIKTDLMNRQMELTKLAIEQEKVRGEIQRQEEEEKENQRQRDREKEKEKQKEKDKKEENKKEPNIGQEPEGQKA